MRSKFALFFAVVLFVSAVEIEIGHAQDDQAVKADVPFDFYAGNQKMSAGAYFLKFDFGVNNVEIMDADGHGMFLLRSDIEDTKTRTAALVFDHLGDSYFLKTLEAPGVEINFAVKDAEKKLALNASPTPVVVAANLR